jgi:hypothetical protein
VRSEKAEGRRREAEGKEYLAEAHRRECRAPRGKMGSEVWEWFDSWPLLVKSGDSARLEVE